MLFPKSTIGALHTRKNSSVALKTYNQSNTGQLSVCTVRLGHKDSTARCIFIVLLGDGQTLLLMPKNELLVILKIMWEVVGGQQAHGEFDFQTIELSMQSKYRQEDQVRPSGRQKNKTGITTRNSP